MSEKRRDSATGFCATAKASVLTDGICLSMLTGMGKSGIYTAGGWIRMTAPRQHDSAGFGAEICILEDRHQA